MQVAYVLGNGPSLDRLDLSKLQGKTYGCNRVYERFAPDVLVSVDPWWQQEIICSGYVLEHDCVFKGWNPMPVGVPLEVGVPVDYTIHELNVDCDPEYWVMYALTEADYADTVSRDFVLPYWQGNTAFVCWVPVGARVERLTSELPSREVIPSGAYALEMALSSGVERVEVYGFDSVAGNYLTSTSPSGEFYENVEEDWLQWYDLLQTKYDVEVIWHK